MVGRKDGLLLFVQQYWSSRGVNLKIDDETKWEEVEQILPSGESSVLTKAPHDERKGI